MKSLHLGKLGEEIACRYLQERGYIITARNARILRTEVDIIAIHNCVLVFVEVKTRRTEHYGSGMESVDERKQKRLMLAANIYMSRLNQREVCGCRFDVISIKINPSTQTASAIHHCQDAFRGL